MELSVMIKVFYISAILRGSHYLHVASETEELGF